MNDKSQENVDHLNCSAYNNSVKWSISYILLGGTCDGKRE